MKRLKVIALALIALVLAPATAQAFDIPLLTWERGREQQVVLGGGAYASDYVVTLEGNGQDPLTFTASSKNEAGYIVYSLRIPADFPTGAYSIVTIGNGSPRTTVAGVSLIEAQSYTVTSNLFDLTLIIAIFVFLTGIVSTIRARKYSFIGFASAQVLPRLTDPIYEDEGNFFARLEKAPYRIRVRLLTSLNPSILRFILVREGELSHRISKLLYGLTPLVGAIAGVITGVELNRNGGIATTPMTIFIIVAAIAIFDAFAGVMATLAFWASQVFTGNVTSFRDVMVALAIGLAWVGPSLFAALLRDVIGRDFTSRNTAGRDPIQVLGILGSALVGTSVFYLGHALVNSVIYTEQLIRDISLAQIAVITGALLIRGFADLIVLASTKTVETRDESFYIARVNSPVTAFAMIATIYAFVFIWTENAQNSFFVAILFALPYFFSFIRFGAIKLIKSDRIPRNILLESAVISGVTFIVFRQISTQPLLIDQRAFLMLLLAGIAPVLHAIYSAIYSSNEEKFSFEENLEIIKP
ncbi:MAG: hypothetical protein RJA33_650 [Actinomycetota bacterium]|jgi:hypothetical protein